VVVCGELVVKALAIEGIAALPIDAAAEEIELRALPLPESSEPEKHFPRSRKRLRIDSS
jgi:hypothetical protein